MEDVARGADDPVERTKRLVGENIRHHRERLGWSRRYLGESTRADLSERQIMFIEQGKATAGLDSLTRICNALGIGFADLFADRSDPDAGNRWFRHMLIYQGVSAEQIPDVARNRTGWTQSFEANVAEFEGRRAAWLGRSSRMAS